MGSLIKYVGQQRGDRGPLHWERVAHQVDGLPFRGDPPLFVDEDDATDRLVTVGDARVEIFDLSSTSDYYETGGEYIHGRLSFQNVVDSILNDWFTQVRIDWDYDKPKHRILAIWAEWFKEDRKQMRYRTRAPGLENAATQVMPSGTPQNCLNKVPAPNSVPPNPYDPANPF